MQHCDSDGQMMLFSLEEADEIYEKPPKQKSKTLTLSTLISIPYFHLDLSKGHVDLFGCHYWEFRSPWRENGPPLNTGPAPRKPIKCALSDILETSPQRKYYLSRTACMGILRRAEERGKELPPQLKEALITQAGLAVRHNGTRPESSLETSAHASTNTGPVAFAANQREKMNCRKAAGEAALGREVRDLHDIAGAVQAQQDGAPARTQQSGSCGERSRNVMAELLPLGRSEGYEVCGDEKQQTFIAENCLNPQDIQQARGFTTVEETPVLAAGFCAGAAPTAGGIGYQEEVSPTLKASESGTNMVPSILCLNDQGGAVMECSEDVSGTLRAQEHGHQPLVLATQQSGVKADAGSCPAITAATGVSGKNQPVLFENHGIDARYKGPLPVAPTLPARAGTGGNNLSLVAQATASAVFSRQRVDIFKDNDVVSTESARQHKDATDLVYQETVGALTSSDRKGPNSQYVGQDKLVVDGPLLIRRLTPLECERLQGFPDGWTDLPGASDSARYRALGNSVAIPCVEFVVRGISMAVLYWLFG